MRTFWFYSSVVLLVACFSFVVNFQRHISLLGGGDEGSYIAFGKLLSQSLSFVREDAPATTGSKYLVPRRYIPLAMKMVSRDRNPVRIMSGWNKGYGFVSIPFWWLDPDNGWKYVSPLAGAVSIVLIFLIGAKVCSAPAGLFAALFLATNWLQLWFSRYPMTETLSQCCTLGLLYIFLLHYQKPSAWYLAGYGLLAGFSSFVHFGNIPTWGLLAGFFCLCALPFKRESSSDTGPGGSWMTTARSILSKWSFASDRVSEFLKTIFFTLIVPVALSVAYWWMDPGIQRYTRLGKKMARSSDQASRLIETVVTRLENLSLFLSGPMIILLIAACWLFIKNAGVKRFLWLVFAALAVSSFLIIATAGLGMPRVLYVARRNVPVILPMICLFAGIALTYLACHLKRFKTGVVVAPVIACLISLQQLLTFLPFNELDQGKGMPEVANRIRAELQANYSGRPQYVILPKFSEIFSAGLRYVYGVPVIAFSDALTATIINQMLDDGVELYVLDSFGTVAEPLRRMPGIKLKYITIREIRWAHANHLHVRKFPYISEKVKLPLGFFRVLRAPAKH